ncbi:nonstructural protein [Wuhan horsefly Virus]|uniref:Nonstructural protein n=1 Tax=Wuhan horsefly Virus TaxID=1608139 RepID=A0A0B5KS73_9VIRU|nr:nonstructural protein [Wuhan horsefly Virus]AJG39321.1 nonstructural protein [Wuhan horsefly Virus]
MLKKYLKEKSKKDKKRENTLVVSTAGEASHSRGAIPKTQRIIRYSQRELKEQDKILQQKNNGDIGNMDSVRERIFESHYRSMETTPSELKGMLELLSYYPRAPTETFTSLKISSPVQVTDGLSIMEIINGERISTGWKHPVGFVGFPRIIFIFNACSPDDPGVIIVSLTHKGIKDPCGATLKRFTGPVNKTWSIAFSLKHMVAIQDIEKLQIHCLVEDSNREDSVIGKLDMHFTLDLSTTPMIINYPETTYYIHPELDVKKYIEEIDKASIKKFREEDEARLLRTRNYAISKSTGVDDSIHIQPSAPMNENEKIIINLDPKIDDGFNLKSNKGADSLHTTQEEEIRRKLRDLAIRGKKQ